MKKFVFMLLLVFALTPLSVSAETNYAEGLSWGPGLTCQVDTKGQETEFTNITYSFSSGYFDILPALKKAIGNNSAVTVTVSGETKATFKNGQTASVCNSLIRAHTNLKDPKEWTVQYEKSLNGTEPFFKDATSNVLHGLGKTVPLTQDWSKFSVDITVTKEQVNSPLTPNWNFCFDGIDVDTVSSIKIKNMKITVNSTVQTTKAPSKPINIITPAPTPTPTPSPSPSPTPDWKEQPIVTDMSAMVSTAIKASVAIIAVVGLIYIVTTYSIKRKR